MRASKSWSLLLLASARVSPTFAFAPASLVARGLQSYRPTPSFVAMALDAAKNPTYGTSNSNGVAETVLEYTPIPSIAPIVNDAHATYATHVTHPYEFRMEQLRGIERLVHENYDELVAALGKDLGQGPLFCDAFELNNVVAWSRYAQSNLKDWMATKRTPTPFPVNLNMPVHSELAPNPRGVCTIITPWNLPCQLVLHPLMGEFVCLTLPTVFFCRYSHDDVDCFVCNRCTGCGECLRC